MQGGFIKETIKNDLWTKLATWNSNFRIRIPTAWKTYFSIADILVTYWMRINMTQAKTGWHKVHTEFTKKDLLHTVSPS